MADEWVETRVKDLVNSGALSVSDGYRVRNEELGPKGIPFVRGGDIGDGWINTTTTDHIKPEFADRVREKLTKPGDAAFITKGTVGRAGWLRPEQPQVVFAPQVAYWRALDPTVLDGRFIFYLMQSYEFQSALDGVKTHGAMVADYVSISQQHDFSFRLPSVETQRAIAHILGTLDDKIELNRRMSENLEEMARALFKSWFVDFDPVRAKAEGRDTGLPTQLADRFPARLVESHLGELPEGWAVGTFSETVDVLREQVNPLDSPSVQFRHFSIPAFDEDQWPKHEFGEAIKSQKFRVVPGVVLLSKLNPEIERVWLADIEKNSPSVCSTEFLVLRPRPPTGRTFVYCLARSSTFRQGIEGLVTGTSKSHQRAQQSSILALPVIQPPPAVAREFENRAEFLLQRSHSCRNESRALTSLRDLLLPKLVSGEIRVQNPENLVGVPTEPVGAAL